MASRIPCGCCKPDKWFYVIKTWANRVFVKEAKFFISQGGLESDWGKHWKKIKATSIEEARQKGMDKLPLPKQQ